MGEATFVGTSGRVFPKSMKASPLLRAWLRRLASQGVAVETRHRWLGWNPAGHLRFDTPAGGKTIAADATILALGGASWPRLGADGSWTTILEHDGITITPLAPANCGFRIAWSEHLRSKFAGTPLKRLALSHAGEWIMGEALITRDGIEGGAVYALSSRLRKAIAADGTTTLLIDLRPDVSLDALSAKLSGPRGKQSLASHLRKAGGLPPVAIALLHETALATATPLAALDPAALATAIKSTPLRLLAPFSLDRAISTAGGVDFAEINDDFMLRRRPGVFVAGEMLDWDAPTGGYLLQACLATGAAAARGVLHRLDQ